MLFLAILGCVLQGQERPSQTTVHKTRSRPIGARFQKLSNPNAVALDASGDLLIADTGNCRIRRVDADGIARLVAGNGRPGSSGDDGPATLASLSAPASIAVDRYGNIFIADTGNHRIRRVDTAGIITTVAGTGRAGFSGDDGAAVSAELDGPTGIAADSDGDLYIADTGNSRIRRVDTAGNITTVAGAGPPGFGGDGGPATKAKLAAPAGVAVDSLGNLYVADTGNNRVRRVDASSGTITTVAGNGGIGFAGDGAPPAKATLAAPRGVAVDDDEEIFIADTGNNRVRRIDSGTGVIVTVAGSNASGFSGDDDTATATSLANPSSVAIGSDGSLFIADRLNQRIRRVDGAGAITTVAGNGMAGDDALNQPPVADAGPDQTVPCTTSGVTKVTLDGSASFDPDGDELTFNWTGPFSQAPGPRPEVLLPLGSSTVKLVVNDGEANSKPATTTVTVVARVKSLSAALANLVPKGEPIPVPRTQLEPAEELPLKVGLFCEQLVLGAHDVGAPQIVELARDGHPLDLESPDLSAGTSAGARSQFRFLDGEWVLALNAKILAPGSYLVILQMPDGRRFAANFIVGGRASGGVSTSEPVPLERVARPNAY